MTPEQLKVSILQYAMQGKLVEQDQKKIQLKNSISRYKRLPNQTKE